jgi:hypothetical protein
LPAFDRGRSGQTSSCLGALTETVQDETPMHRLW